MGEKTKIQWCDMTFSPWRGCAKVAAGCQHCFSEAMAKRNPKVFGTWGPDGSRVVASDAYWRQPVRWNAAAEFWGQCSVCGWRGNVGPSNGCCGRPGCLGLPSEVDKARPRVFCGSMCDVFEDRNDLHEPRARLIRLIDATPHLDWLLLTKRAEKVMSILCTMAHSLNDGMAAWWRYVEGFPKNVWLGVSCSTQEDVDRNVPHLLRIPAAVRFLSLEPLLEAIELPGGLRGEEVCPECGGDAGANSDGTWQCVAIVDGNLGCGWRGEEATSAPSIDWVIVGGESGPRARPCHVDWIRSVMAQCTAACVARFVKQLGFDVRGNYDDFQYLTQTSHLLGMGDFHDGAGDSHVIRLGDARGGRPDEWPADLQVREFPSVRAKR